ncbi:hypothetical protein BT69DRAFT_871880 [Atractiella rhizophila]|nr:hypothetical protein BT69DRAFT_871880 [Atractiella rhizophila]
MGIRRLYFSLVRLSSSSLQQSQSSLSCSHRTTTARTTGSPLLQEVPSCLTGIRNLCALGKRVGATAPPRNTKTTKQSCGASRASEQLRSVLKRKPLNLIQSISGLCHAHDKEHGRDRNGRNGINAKRNCLLSPNRSGEKHSGS